MQNNEELPRISRTNLWRLFKKLDFIWERRKNNLLVEKPEIILWRLRYLTTIKRMRRERRKIYYLPPISTLKHVNCSEGLTLAFLESGKLLRWSVRYLRGLTLQ